MGVDALQIDTVKHIERGNLLEYVNAWKAHKPGLFVFGKNLVKGYGWGDLGSSDNGPSQIHPWWYTRLGHDPRDPDPGDDSGFPQLDFGLFSTFRDNLSRSSFEGIARVPEMDRIYGNATELVTFLIGNDDTLETTGRAYFGDHIDDEHIAATRRPSPIQAHPTPQPDPPCRPRPMLCKAPMSHIAEWDSGISFVRDWN